MGTWLQTVIGNGAGSEALVVLIDAGLKGFALLAIAAIVTLVMKRSAAAARHLVWMLALVGLLLLPVVSMVMPTWQLPLLPAIESADEVIPPATSPLQAPSVGAEAGGRVFLPATKDAISQPMPPSLGKRQGTFDDGPDKSPIQKNTVLMHNDLRVQNMPIIDFCRGRL